MRVTPGRMMAFRLLNITICRLRLGDRLVRRVLESLLIRRRADTTPYCQAADFFTFDQIANSNSANDAQGRRRSCD